MRWLIVSTLRRGVLDTPEVLDDERAKLAELSWELSIEAEYGDRDELWRHLRSGALLNQKSQIEECEEGHGGEQQD